MYSHYLFSKQKLVVWLIVMLLMCSHLFAQQKKMTYSIINKNDTIGQMQITKRVAGEDVFFTVASLVETRMVMNIKVNIQEESHYHKDRLILSTSKRFVNDKVKGNKETKSEGSSYLLTDDNKQEKLNRKTISYNFSKLYFTEPVSIKEIYSDYYQRYLVIQPQDNHCYKIDLPDGGSNLYYYTDGVCKKVDMHSTLFSTQMILNE